MIKTITGQTTEYKSYTTTLDGITDIDINLKEKRLEIYSVPGDEIVIDYPYYSDEKYDFNIISGRLTLNYSTSRRWYSNFVNGIFSQLRDSTVRIGIPESYTNSLNTITSNSKISLDGITLLDSVKLQTTNSTIEVTGLNAKELSLSSSNGSIKSAATKVEGRFEARTTNASITLDGVTSAYGSFTTSNSSLRLENADIYELYATTSNGAVRLSSINTTKASFKTTNASITGSILGEQKDFSLALSTTNASVNPTPVLNANAKKSITATTTNGRINIEFESII